MHIDNTYLTNRPAAQPEQPTATQDAASRAAASGPPPAASSHVPSPELLDLAARVKQQPEVRPDVVARVAQRLAGGYYLSRQAATDTAEAIQGARE